MIKYIFALLVCTLINWSVFAQEKLTMPVFNPTVAKAFEARSAILKANQVSSVALTLPFYDDFSVLSVYPSPLRWADAFAFINTDYAKFSPSVGVATLDAIDDKGAMYPNAGPNPFDADYLTSQPIRLDSIFSPDRAITRADSVYLSFYYQPQGRTISPPSKNASLQLEFHSPDEFDTVYTETDTIILPRWNTVWTIPGGIQVDSFAKPDNHYFRQILIPILSIDDSVKYYKNGFQFRFHNIAALSGNSQPDWRNNGSHWNIDLVWLNTGKIATPDVAFADRAPSMLKSYESMPYRQYCKNFINEMKDTLDISIANLDNKDQNRIYHYDVSKNSLAPFTAYDGGVQTLSPFNTTGYSTFPAWAKPPVNFFFPISNEEKVVFHIEHTLTNDPAFPLGWSNDTIRYEQMFSNYYAYDNGTPEAGVGINGAAGSYAVQFKLNESDTLQGIQVFFNQVISGGNLDFIDLNIWNDAFGAPGQIIKTLAGVTPVYTSSLNELNTYWFEEPLIIDPVTFPSLYFYVGWTQTSVNNINIGLDRRTDSHSKRFFNVSGNWEGSDSVNYGSLMLRPIVGPRNPLGIENPAEKQKLSIYPNPVTDGRLIIKLPETWINVPDERLFITIFQANGSIALQETFSNPVDVSNLSSGFYMITLTDKESGRKVSSKFIVR